MPIKGDRTRIHIPLPQEELEQGRFPRTRRPNDAQGLPLFQRKINLGQGFLLVVRKTVDGIDQIPILNAWQGLASFYYIGLLGQEAINPLIRNRPPLNDIEKKTHSLQRPNQHIQIGDKSYQLTDRQFPSGNEEAAHKKGQNIR